MPSEWKFEIESLEEVESLLAQKGLKKALEEKLVDVYYETSFNSTLKIRIFSILMRGLFFLEGMIKGKSKT